MKITLYTLYSLRLLVHLAASPGRLASISEIARNFGIPHNHLTKIAQDLRKAGYIDAVRGRSGGIQLARPAEDISVGEVVRHTEKQLGRKDSDRPSDEPHRRLRALFDRALQAYVEALDRCTLVEVAATGARGAAPKEVG